jgi:hypothetical protein
MLRRLLALAAIAFGSPVLAQPAELIVWGGPVYTAVEAKPKAEAVAVRAGRIVYVGDRKGAEALAGAATQVVDLKGAALFPGFTDSHAHLRGIGERELTLNLEGAESLAAVVEAVRSRASAAQPGEAIVGRGWIETHWPEKRFPVSADIDTVAPNNPVVLIRADGHALVANSAALKRAGVTAATQPPSGGDILKDAQGRPTGMLIDAAMGLVRQTLPQPTEAQRLAAHRAAFKVYARYGWTGLHNMSVDWADVLQLEAMAQRGEAPLRVYNAVTPEAAPALLEGGPRMSPDHRVVTRAIKFYADGALGSRGAALFEPYADAPTRGLVLLQPEAVMPLYERSLREGIQVVTHAIGDRGNSIVLDAYAQVFDAVASDMRKLKEPRWRVEHAQVLTTTDVPRFNALGVIASMQPSHAIGDLHFAPARLGEARLGGAYAWRSLLDAGAVVVAGSDAPVERGDPLIEFYAAVARKDLKGFSGPGWRPEQAVDRTAALKMFTSAAAFGRFAEAELGTIEVGKRADLTGFSVDLMTAPFEDIPQGHAVLTVVDGQVVFRRD